MVVISLCVVFRVPFLLDKFYFDDDDDGKKKKNGCVLPVCGSV